MHEKSQTRKKFVLDTDELILNRTSGVYTGCKAKLMDTISFSVIDLKIVGGIVVQTSDTFVANEAFPVGVEICLVVVSCLAQIPVFQRAFHEPDTFRIEDRPRGVRRVVVRVDPQHVTPCVARWCTRGRRTGIVRGSHCRKK